LRVVASLKRVSKADGPCRNSALPGTAILSAASIVQTQQLKIVIAFLMLMTNDEDDDDGDVGVVVHDVVVGNNR